MDIEDCIQNRLLSLTVLQCKNGWIRQFNYEALLIVFNCNVPYVNVTITHNQYPGFITRHLHCHYTKSSLVMCNLLFKCMGFCSSLEMERIKFRYITLQSMAVHVMSISVLFTQKRYSVRLET